MIINNKRCSHCTGCRIWISLFKKKFHQIHYFFVVLCFWCVSVMYVPAAFLDLHRASYSQSKEEMEIHMSAAVQHRHSQNLPFKPL